MIICADLKKFMEENVLLEDTEIQVSDREKGSTGASALIILNEIDDRFKIGKPNVKYGCPVCESLGNKHQISIGIRNCPLCNVNLLWEE